MFMFGLVAFLEIKHVADVFGRRLLLVSAVGFEHMSNRLYICSLCLYVNYHRTSPVASVVRKNWQHFWAGSQVSSSVRLIRCGTAPAMEIYPKARLSYFQPLRRSLVAFFHSGHYSALNSTMSA